MALITDTQDFKSATIVFTRSTVACEAGRSLTSRVLRDLGLSRIHRRDKRLNNRAESSHVPIRRRERKMQGFRSAGSAQRFLSSYSASYNTFNISRHLTTADTHRILRSQAFDTWKTAVTAYA